MDEHSEVATVDGAAEALLANVHLDDNRRGLLELKMADYFRMQQAMEEAARRIAELESTVALQQLENDTLELHLAEARAAVHIHDEATRQALAQRAAYETVFTLVGNAMRDFVPPAAAVITRTAVAVSKEKQT